MTDAARVLESRTMATNIQRITPFLWFDHQAEKAAGFYTSIFPNSKIGSVTRYAPENVAFTGKPAGSVMTVAFELDWQSFVALNGGAIFKFTEAVSFVVNCQSGDEVDHYWSKLTAGGDDKAQQCGWLKDKFGLSWQIVPTLLIELLKDPDAGKAHRVMKAMLRMKKIDVEELKRAANGR